MLSVKKFDFHFQRILDATSNMAQIAQCDHDHGDEGD